jgi:purine-binding chemotaxis protein CheW
MQLQTIFTREEWEILQLRAERVAAPLQEDDRAGYLTALIAVLRQEKYALPLDTITAVYERVVIVPVPCVPNFVAGIANVRGHILTVLDLAALLGLESSNNSAESAMLVTEADDGSIGFRVEAIGEVVELPMSQVNPVPTNMNIAQAEYLQGIFPDGTALLNLKAILNDSRLIIDEPPD